MTTETILTGESIAEALVKNDIFLYAWEVTRYDIGFARAIEQAVLQSDPIQSMQGMADCMAMVRQELIEAGVITDEVPPMMVANAVLAEIQALRKDAETERAIQRAADVLPRDWQITVEVEQGSGYVSLYFQGDEIEFDDPSDGIADRIKAAISAAMEQQHD